MFNFRRSLLSDDIQLEGRLDDGVCTMKNDGVFAMFECDGVYPFTADARDTAIWFDREHSTWMGVGNEEIELIYYECHGDADRTSVPAGIHAHSDVACLAKEYENNLYKTGLYRNKLYLGITLHKTTFQKIKRRFKRQDTSMAERGERLNDLCDLLQTRLKPFGLRRLGYREQGNGLFDEIAEALALALTGIWRPVPATTGSMSNTIFAESFYFPERERHIEIDSPGGVSYAAMFAMKEYPMATWPGMLMAFSSASYCCTLVQKFRFYSNADAMDHITKIQNQRITAEDKAYEQTEKLAIAANDLLDRKMKLGSHSLELLVFADTLPALKAVANVAFNDMQSSNLSSTRLINVLQSGWLSLLPGNAHLSPRPGVIKTGNLVAFMPLYNCPAGPELSQWGPPIITFRTKDGTPYKFHWHISGKNPKALVMGSALLTGVPGSGKTFLAAMLIAMSAGRARVIGLDHKRGWQFLTKFMKGKYGVLGHGKPNFAVLKALTNSPKDLEFLTKLITGCIGGKMTEEESRRLSLGLEIIMGMPAKDRSLKELRRFFDNEPEAAGTRLNKWIWGNEMGWVIDAPDDHLSFTDFTILDVTALLGNETARGPALAYIFYRIVMMLDGRPLMIPFDEGWRILMDAFFSSIIEELLRTIRSKNGILVFITQDPGELARSSISDVLLTMCPTQFHLANPKGNERHYIDKLKLTQRQYDVFREILPGEGEFLLIQGDKSIVGSMPMHNMLDYVPMLSATEEDLIRLDVEENLEAVA